MARKILILGQTGTGKTHSIKGFKKDEVTVIEIHKPELSFRNEEEIPVIKASKASDVVKAMKNAKTPIIVIDDFQFLLGIATMKRSLEKGWDKFSEMQFDYFTVLDAVEELPDDKIVVFMSHTEKDEDGEVKIKTIGKALDKYITIESLFTIVLGTQVVDGQYYFVTQNNGKNTLKSPEGMFTSYAIQNDLPYVIDKVRNYYYMDGAKSDEEMIQEDKDASAPEVTKESTSGRRSRRSTEPASVPEETKEEPRKRRSRSEAKQEEIQKELDKVDELAGDREEVPFEELEKNLPSEHEENHAETPSRRRKSRNAESEQKYLDHDAYFRTKHGNYIMKHEGDLIPEDAEEISKEEFVKGGSEVATETPTRRRRTRKE